MATMYDLRSRAETPMKAGLIRAIEERSPFYNYLTLRQTDSIFYGMRQQGDLPEASFRNYNATFGNQDTAPVDLIQISMADFGLSTSTDPVMAKERTREGGNYMASMRAELAYSVGLDWKKHIIGGSHAVGQPLGLKQWVDFYNASDNQLVFTTATNGEKLSASGALQRFISSMAQLIQAVQPDVFVTNRKVIADLHSLAVTSAQNNVLAAMFSYETAVVNGRPELVTRFQGVPIVEAGIDSRGAEIIQYNETVGTSSDCTTVYGIRNGNGNFSIIHRNPGLIEYTESVEGQREILTISAPFAAVAENTRCVGRVKGIKQE